MSSSSTSRSEIDARREALGEAYIDCFSALAFHPTNDANPLAILWRAYMATFGGLEDQHAEPSEREDGRPYTAEEFGSLSGY